MRTEWNYPKTDEEAIKFVQDPNNIEPFILVLFENTYNKYFLELIEKNITDFSLSDDNFDKIKNNLYDKIIIKNSDGISSINEPFKKHVCQEFSFNGQKGRLLTEEQFDDICKKLSDENGITSEEDKKLIVKIWRAYNMYLKYGHSAKATWVANYILSRTIQETRKFIAPNDVIKLDNLTKLEKILKSIVLPSTFQHDLGRFYQAVNYDTLDDKVMAGSEKEKVKDYLGDVFFRHAEAGYYYVTATSNELNKNSSFDLEKFVVAQLSACVIRHHSLVNSLLVDYEFDKPLYEIDLNQVNDLLSNLSKFFIDGYDTIEHSKQKEEYRLLLPETYKNFVNEIITKTVHDFNVSEIGMVCDDEYSRLSNELRNGISEILYNSEVMETLLSRKNKISEVLPKLSAQIAKKIKEILENFRGKSNVRVTNLDIDDNNELATKITEILEESLDYDIARIIHENIGKYDGLSELSKFGVSVSMCTPLDSDKIDILDQRGKGIYNSPYRMKSIDIYPPEKKCFIDLLRDYFQFSNSDIQNNVFDFSDDNLNYFLTIDKKEYLNKNNITDEKIKKEYEIISLFIEFINQKNIKNVLINYLSKNKSNYLINESDIIQSIDFKSGEVIFRKVDSEGNINLNPIKVNVGDLFTNKNWYDFSLETIPDLKKNDNFNEIKKDTIGKMKLLISRELFFRNVDNKYIYEKDKVTAFKKIVIGENDLNTCSELNTIPGRFKLASDNPNANGWILKTNEGHILSSSITAVLWHLNQYILVNMRSIYSLELLQISGVLDDIIETYKQKNSNDRNYEGEILLEYINYSKGFIQFALDYCKSKKITFLAPEIMNTLRIEYNNINKKTLDTISGIENSALTLK